MMILNHINHKMPIYKDCTFFEVAIVGLGVFLLLITGLSLLTMLLFGYALIGVALAVFSTTFVTRLLLNQLQRLKYGKPYGHYQHLFLKKISTVSWIASMWPSPFITRKIRWSVRRMRHGH